MARLLWYPHQKKKVWEQIYKCTNVCVLMIFHGLYNHFQYVQHHFWCKICQYHLTDTEK